MLGVHKRIERDSGKAAQGITGAVHPGRSMCQSAQKDSLSRPVSGLLRTTFRSGERQDLRDFPMTAG